MIDPGTLSTQRSVWRVFVCQMPWPAGDLRLVDPEFVPGGTVLRRGWGCGATALLIAQQLLLGGFKYFLMFTSTWGNDPI